ncbi:TIGR00341 family protein [Kordiimonas marina]|uniref:TIGR00341 family protein n=1 Tax=Kordiimonas marina TaxID=2872312 RepID=UPI001FF1805F|nr:TIGR00341 family protein [Kordiimonas marina]MCJ9427501.1 TIGR00341 family protein [Kordiimonas marina]
MAIKLLRVTAPIAAEASISKLAQTGGVISFYKGTELEDDHALYFMLIGTERRQKLIDELQKLLDTSSKARIDIMPVDATLPPVEMPGASDTREELYQKIGQGVHFDLSYLVLTFLSTIVALIGLVQDNVAVIIGAMVIAPFLGPNLAFAFGTSLGDRELMWKAFRTGTGGVAFAVFISAVTGLIWHQPPASHELLIRTEVGIGSVALAAASGVAGVLSLTSGLSMTLVGVMVAVALLPPAATCGFMIGVMDFKAAFGAFLLLSVNVVCVNLSGLMVFMAKGIRAREWFERRMAKPYVYGGVLVWSLLLAALIIAIDLLPASFRVAQ